MRAHRIFLNIAIAVGCSITLQSTAFSQDYRGTWEQQRACTPDVWRLCGSQIPDVDRIVACLRRNSPQLSDRCRAVFEQSDAPSRGEDRDYGQRRHGCRDYGCEALRSRLWAEGLRQGIRAKALRLRRRMKGRQTALALLVRIGRHVSCASCLLYPMALEIEQGHIGTLSCLD